MLVVVLRGGFGCSFSMCESDLFVGTAVFKGMRSSPFRCPGFRVCMQNGGTRRIFPHSPGRSEPRLVDEHRACPPFARCEMISSTRLWIGSVVVEV